MKRFLHGLNVFALLLVFAISAQAAPAETTCTKNMEADAFWKLNETADGWNPRGNTLGENAKAFFDESNLNLEFRNVWEESRTNTGFTSENEVVRWAQMGTLRFSSGMFLGLVGVDTVWFGVSRLRDEESHRDPTFFKNYDESFAKGGATLKISPFKGLLLKAGRMESPHILLGPGDFRTTPRMYELAMARYSRGPWTTSFIHTTKISDYTQESFHDFAMNRGTRRNKDLKEEPVNIGDIRYEQDNVMFNAAYARQEDFSNYMFAESRVTWPLTDDLSVRTDLNFRQKDFENKLVKQLDHTMSMWAGRIVTDYKRARLTLAYSAVENNSDFGKRSDGTMGADWFSDGTMIAGCKDAGMYTDAVQGIFTHDGENAFKIEPEYRFGGFLEGLTLSAYYVRGWDMHDGVSPYNKNQRQQEYGGHLRYTPEFLKGFTLEAKHGRNNMKTDEYHGYSMDQTMKRTQIDVKYTVALF